jgi:hypothetical protein
MSIWRKAFYFTYYSQDLRRLHTIIVVSPIVPQNRLIPAKHQFSFGLGGNIGNLRNISNYILTKSVFPW